MTAVAPDLPAELVGVEWTLREFRRDGATNEPPKGSAEVVLRFSSDGRLSGTDGCNFIGGRVEVRGSQLLMRSLATTDILCSGIVEFAEFVCAVLRGPSSWVVRNRTLRLTANDDACLVYQQRASIFPSDRPGYPAPHVLLQGRLGDGDYRVHYQVSAERVGLEMESRDTPGRAWGFRGTSRKPGDGGPQPDPMSCATSQVDGERFVAGLVDRDVARIVFRVLGDAREIDLPLYALEDTEIRAFGGFVGDPPRGSQLLAYDRAGALLGPPYAPHWWVAGDPI